MPAANVRSFFVHDKFNIADIFSDRVIFVFCVYYIGRWGEGGGEGAGFKIIF